MTLNYIGSKKTLLPFLDYVITENITGENLTFGDLFAGTGIVGNHFSNKGFIVTGNDTEHYSYVINHATLKSSYSSKLELLIDTLNNLTGVKGLIYKHFSRDRMYFTKSNAKKADAVRIKIEELKNANMIDINEYYFLLASLLQSLDKVANTTSVYAGFLKEFKSSAIKTLIIKPIHTNINNGKNTVYRKDVLDITDEFDVIYLDPPYVARQYGSCYSPLNFVVEYNTDIEIRGITGIYDYYKSPFATKTKARSAFIKLFEILTKKCNHIFLSYSNDGILSLDEMVDIMNKYGKVITYKFAYKKFQTLKSKSGRTEEYIHYLHCSATSSEINQVTVTKNINGKFEIN